MMEQKIDIRVITEDNTNCEASFVEVRQKKISGLYDASKKLVYVIDVSVLFFT